MIDGAGVEQGRRRESSARGASTRSHLGGVERPRYVNIEAFTFTVCAMQALPLLLIPFLVPRGSPNGTAQEMGAGTAVTGARKAAVADEWCPTGGIDEDADVGVSLHQASNVA